MSLVRHVLQPTVKGNVWRFLGKQGAARDVASVYASDMLGAEAASMNAILVRSAHPQAKRCCQSLTDALTILSAEPLG